MRERLLRLLPFVSIRFALSGCGGGGNGPPTDPRNPDASSAQVDSVAIQPGDAAIEEGETVQLSAEVYDPFGETRTA